MRLKALTPDELNEAQAALYEQIAGGKRASGPFRLVEKDGSLTGPFNLMLHSPNVGGALSSLGEAIRYCSNLEDRTREVAILTVAVARDSPFEWYAHERVARKLGMLDAELQAIRELDPSGLPHDEALVLLLSRALAEKRPISAELFSAAEESLGTEQLVELGVLVGYYELLAGAMELFDIGVPDGESDTLAQRS